MKKLARRSRGPAQLAIPDLAGTAAAERLRQRSIHQTHLEFRATYNFGCCGVFGDFLA
jgi:hypothetical protein